MEIHLKNKTDQCLVDDLKGLVARERETLTKILSYLREVDARRIYLARGYPSLFAWMRSELGYSEASAQRRIAAMRLIVDIPEVKEHIQQGEMSLSVVSQVQSYFRRENQKRREKLKKPLPKEEKLSLLTQLKGTSSRECERKLIQLSPELNLPKEKARPVSDTRTLIQFTVGKALMEKIERLKGLTSHQNPMGRYERLFEKAVDLALERLDPVLREARRRNRQNRKNRQDQPKAAAPEGKDQAKSEDTSAPIPTSEMKSAFSHTLPPTVKMNIPSRNTLAVPAKPRMKKKSRHIPAGLRDRIWQRDQGRCRHQDPKTGKFCGSKKYLQVDHRFAFALGGEHQEGNLRLLCRAHNQYRSERLFGRPGPTASWDR